MADFETNPILALWKLLPPEARKSYGSMANFAGELSPGAAVRDVVDESGNMVKAAQRGDLIDAASGPAKMAVAALGVMPFARAARMEAKAAQDTLRGYHGSPHDFDKFDLSGAKLRTGEGANVYGSGTYIADNPEVARRYRDALENKAHGPGSPNLNSPEWLARSVLDATNGDPAKALAEIDRRIDALRNTNPKYVTPGGQEHFAAAREIIAQGKSPGGGKMYEVKVHADPQRFINYDAPLSQQTPEVQKALGLRPVPVRPETPLFGGQQYHSELLDLPLESRTSLPAGKVLPVKNPESVAAMEQAGIPGLRFWDRGSRQDATGTKNTVVFPTQQEIIEILRKYGMAPVAAGGAAATVPGLLADDQGAY